MKLCPDCNHEFDSTDWLCPHCGFEPERVAGFAALAPELARGGAAFPEEAFAELAELEAGNFWFRARNRLIVWGLHRFFPRMARYLEVGCGSGFVLSGVARAFPGVRITGSEAFSSGLGFAVDRAAGAELLQMDARAIPYREEFDVIGAFDVLEHIEEDEDVLNQMHAALGQGGGLVLTVPQHPWMWSAQDDYACHVRRYRVGELRQKTGQAGFEVVLETSFVSLLLPAMFLSRLLQRRQDPGAAPLTELRLPRLINTLFEWCMNIERLLIRAGVRLPLGGSLLLIAKKVNKP